MARARAAGITVPIVPGIMPITNLASVERMTALSGASIPPALRAELDRRRDDPAAVMQLGVAQAAAQCADLLHGGRARHPLLHAQPVARDAHDPDRPQERAAGLSAASERVAQVEGAAHHAGGGDAGELGEAGGGPKEKCRLAVW